jgi:hypothetical protein
MGPEGYKARRSALDRSSESSWDNSLDLQRQTRDPFWIKSGIDFTYLDRRGSEMARNADIANEILDGGDPQDESDIPKEVPPEADKLTDPHNIVRGYKATISRPSKWADLSP